GSFPAKVVVDGVVGDNRGDECLGATLAAAAMRAGLIDEYAIVTHPVLVGGGTPFFTNLDNWVNLALVETRTFPDGVLLTRYETRS
ncbi:MAG: dihydrofolate reductase family protein, partial [Propionibacteriaceae bacterium]